MVSEAKKKTNMAYDREHTKLIGMKLNLKTDADILAFLATKENVQGYLKDLIRKDMASAAQETTVTTDRQEESFNATMNLFRVLRK